MDPVNIFSELGVSGPPPTNIYKELGIAAPADNRPAEAQQAQSLPKLTTADSPSITDMNDPEYKPTPPPQINPRAFMQDQTPLFPGQIGADLSSLADNNVLGGRRLVGGISDLLGLQSKPELDKYYNQLHQDEQQQRTDNPNAHEWTRLAGQSTLPTVLSSITPGGIAAQAATGAGLGYLSADPDTRGSNAALQGILQGGIAGVGGAILKNAPGVAQAISDAGGTAAQTLGGWLPRSIQKVLEVTPTGTKLNLMKVNEGLKGQILEATNKAVDGVQGGEFLNSAGKVVGQKTPEALLDLAKNKANVGGEYNPAKWANNILSSHELGKLQSIEPEARSGLTQLAETIKKMNVSPIKQDGLLGGSAKIGALLGAGAFHPGATGAALSIGVLGSLANKFGGPVAAIMAKNPGFIKAAVQGLAYGVRVNGQHYSPQSIQNTASKYGITPHDVIMHLQDGGKQ